MSINKLSKEEIIDQLQISEYYRDALHFGVRDMAHILNIDNVDNMTDEEMINIVTYEFTKLIKILPKDIKLKS